MPQASPAPGRTPGAPPLAGTSVPPDPEQVGALRLQLALVAGNAPPAALLEVRAKTPGGMAQRFFGVRDLDAAAAHIRDRAGRGDTYLGAAPRDRAEGGAAAVSASYALWCDLDRPDARAALDGFDPPPSMIVATGTPGHLHAWWQLSEPLPAAMIAGANRRLAHALDGDSASCDVARVLRPCATLSHKTNPPRPVTCEQVAPGRAYTAEQVVGRLPDPPERRPTPAPRPARAGGAGPDPLADLPAALYVEALTGATVPHDGMIRCPLPGHHDRTPSFHAGGPDPTAWRCFGCEQAGGPYELAALLAGLPLPLRGPDYITVRRELSLRLGGGA